MKGIKNRLLSFGLLALALVVLLGVCAPVQSAEASAVGSGNTISYRPSGYDKDYVVTTYLSGGGVTADEITITKDSDPASVDKLTDVGTYSIKKAADSSELCTIEVVAAKLKVSVAETSFEYTGSSIEAAMGLKVLCGDSGEEVVDTTKYDLTKVGDFTEVGSHTITAQPLNTTNYTASDTVTVTITKKQVVYPAITANNTTIDYAPGMTLAAVTLNITYDNTNGTYEWADPSETVGDAGAGKPFAVKFKLTDEAHNELTGTAPTVTVNVNKAQLMVADIQWPTADTVDYDPSKTLNDVALTVPTGGINDKGTFAWENPGTKPTVDVQQYPVRFTLTDTTNYTLANGADYATGNIALHINPLTIDVTTLNVAADNEITFGQPLNDVRITHANGTGVNALTFSWKDGAYLLDAISSPHECEVNISSSDPNIELTADSVTVPVTVNQKPITNDEVTIATQSSTYDGNPVDATTLGVSVAPLAVSDYTVSWENGTDPTDAGSYRVKVALYPVSNHSGGPWYFDYTIDPQTVTLPEIQAIDYDYDPSKQVSSETLNYTSLLGTYAWDSAANEVANAGPHTYQAVFTLNDTTNYVLENGINTKDVTVNVHQATVDPASITWPTVADAYTYKLDGKLSEVDLSAFDTALGTFSWATPEEKPVVTKAQYDAVFTLSDPTNYKFADGSASTTGKAALTVDKYVYDVTSGLPTASALTYGQSIADSTLTQAENDYVIFAWEAPSEKPTADTTTANVTLTLKDSDNVELSDPAPQAIALTVNKATVDSLTLGVTESVYDQNAFDPATLKATATVTAGAVTLEADDFELVCDETMQDADAYTVKVELADTVNFDMPNPVTATYTIKPAQVTSLTLTTTGRPYDKSETHANTLAATVMAGGLTLPQSAYTLTCDQPIVNAGDYAISVQLVDTKNYELPAAGVTATYTVGGATVDKLILDVNTSVYNQNPVALTSLNPTVIAGTVVLEADDYNLFCDGTVQDAGTYAIKVQLTDKGAKNFTVPDTLSAAYTVTPATVDSLTLGVTESVYNQAAVDLTALNPTAKAGELTLPADAYELACDTEVKNAGAYDIKVKLIDTKNYTLSGDVTAAYTVKQATLETLTLGVASSVYDKEKVDLTALNPTLTAAGCPNPVPADDYTLVCDTDVLTVGEYTIKAQLNSAGDALNYTSPAVVSAVYNVTEAVVDSLQLGVTSSVYNQAAIDLTTLAPTVKAGETELPGDAYELILVGATEAKNAGTYTIGVKLLDTDNYAMADPAPTAEYTIEQATLSSLTLGETEKVYDQTATDLTALLNNEGTTLKAETDALTVPKDAYELVCEQDVLNAATYTIQVKLLDTVNYTGEATAEYVIKQATLSSLTLGETGKIYDQTETDLTELLNNAGTVLKAETDTLTVPKDDFTLVCETVKNAGTYTIKVQLKAEGDALNYTGEATAEYVIEQATLSSLTLGVTGKVYDQTATDLTELLNNAGTVLKAENDTLTVPKDDFTLVCDTDVLTVGEHTIKVQLKAEGDALNYKGEATATYTIDQATLSSLTLGVTGKIYDQTATDLTALLNNEGTVLKAENDALIVPKDAYTLECETVLNAGTYTIQVKLADTVNYKGEAKAEYVITPANVKSLTLGVTESVYNRQDVDLSKLQPVVDAITNDDATIILPYGGENPAYEVVCEKTVHNAGTYTLGIKLLDTVNYTNTDNVTAEYTVKRMEVAPLQQSAKVTNSDKVFVLGGPESAGNRTITITGSPNEELVLSGVINGVVKTNGEGFAYVTVKGDELVGQLTAGELEPVAVNGAGAGQAFELTIAYADASNLTDSGEDKDPANNTAPYVYDMEALTVAVEQLYNRAADGVVVSLPEDLTEIAFASAEGAGVAFNGSSANLVKGEGQTIPFSTTNKLHSTVFDPQSIYSVTYTDLVGNVGTVADQTVQQSTGTLKIEAVQPDLNSNKRIGATAALNWTVVCQPTGGSEENVVLNIGGAGFGGTLVPGSNTMTTDTGRLATDRLLNVTISFEDLVGSATFESFVYDPKCDAPVLTSVPYADCFLLSGIVEPGASVQIRVNDIVTRAKVDSYGVFVAQMPVMYEGDVMTITVVDLADNVTVKSYTVGEERLLVRMDAYMLGKTFTNAHEARANEEGEWTTVTTVTDDEIRDGKVVLPIVAGNLVQVGTMTMTMDENGGISYSYTLEDGVELISEDVRVNTTRSKEDAITHAGVLLSTENATKVPTRSGYYYVTAAFEVDVPTDMLQTTFQTESVKDSELKRCYRDRQSNKPLK